MGYTFCLISLSGLKSGTVEPRFNEPLFDELDITNNIFRPGKSLTGHPRSSELLDLTNPFRQPKLN